LIRRVCAAASFFLARLLLGRGWKVGQLFQNWGILMLVRESDKRRGEP